MGPPAVPDGSPSSLLRAVAASGPSTKAVQWCRASRLVTRTRSMTARASASVETGATSHTKRDRRTWTSDRAGPARVR